MMNFHLHRVGSLSYSLSLVSLLSMVLSGELRAGRRAAAAAPIFSHSGVWSGVPEYNVLGPWQSNYTFGINFDPVTGHGMLESLLNWNDGTYGWQRWYVIDGDSNTSSSSSNSNTSQPASSSELLYCGWLIHYLYPEPEMANVLFNVVHNNETHLEMCIKGKGVPGGLMEEPWPKDCLGCSCGKWTIQVEDEDTMTMEVMIPPPVVHLRVTMTRVPDAVAPSTNFSDSIVKERKCDPALGFPELVEGEPKYNVEGNLPMPADHPKVNGTGGKCPFMHAVHPAPLNISSAASSSPSTSPSSSSSSDISATGCLVVNEELDVQLAWNLTQSGLLNLTLSTSHPDAEYISIGFKPEARGTHINSLFGMKDADIVAGFGDHCIQQLALTDQLVGQPSPSSALSIADPRTGVDSEGRRYLSFTRNATGGGLSDATLLGAASRIIWALGNVTQYAGEGDGPVDCDASMLEYHAATRGLRAIAWTENAAITAGQFRCTR